MPCMREGTGFDVPCAYFLCPTGIKSKYKDGGCYLSDVCDMNGIASDPKPNQFYRFLTAIGLHGGILHLIFNLMFQVQAGFDLERVILLS